MEAPQGNSLPFSSGGERIDAVPTVPIWLSLTIILGVLVIATVASLMKTRGEFVDRDEPVIEPEQADEVPLSGPAAEAAAEPRVEPAEDGRRRDRKSVV